MPHTSCFSCAHTTFRSFSLAKYLHPNSYIARSKIRSKKKDRLLFRHHLQARPINLPEMHARHTRKCHLRPLQRRTSRHALLEDDFDSLAM